MPDLTRVYPATFRPFEELQQFGIAVKLNNLGKPHVGVLYRTRESEIRLLHLAWQDDLRCDIPSFSYFWGHASQDILTQRFLAFLAEKVASNLVGRAVDWGWAYCGGPDTPISTEGTWNEVREAMTCATFVLALFATHGLQLISPHTWPVRDEDRQWAKTMLRHLNGSSPEHLSKLEQAIPSMTRIRPFEVVVAVTGIENLLHPYTFSQIEPHSELLQDVLCSG